MQPVRILVVNHCMDRNGAETLIMNIYRHLDREKVQFDFLLHCDYKSDFEDEIESLGGRIFKVPEYKIINHCSYVRKLDSFFDAHPEYHVVHGHLFNRIEYLKVAKRHGLVTIAHCHASTNGKGLSARVADWLHRNINDYTDYRFACSEQAGQWLYGKDSGYKVVPNAIDTDAFAFDTAARQSTRKELGIDEHSFVIGNVGRLIAVKNQGFLLEVFKAFNAKNPESRLLIVGEGPLMEELKAKASDLSIGDKVIFTGSRKDVSSLLSAMDCFVFPSVFEGLPVTLIEAQCSGLPCLVPDHITSEAEVTGLFRRKVLSEGADAWACEITKTEEDRKSYAGKVMSAGYDIRQVAKELQDLYLKLSSQVN